ncbi:hypothetical protein Bca101_056756 [Brassica carinata]
MKMRGYEANEFADARLLKLVRTSGSSTNKPSHHPRHAGKSRLCRSVSPRAVNLPIKPPLSFWVIEAIIAARLLLLLHPIRIICQGSPKRSLL